MTETSNFFSPMNKAHNTANDLFFVITGKKTLIRSENSRFQIPTRKDLEESKIEIKESLYIGSIKDMDCYVMELRGPINPPPQMAISGIWHMFNHIDQRKFNMLLRAFHIVGWIRDEIFCTYCASRLILAWEKKCKFCTNCGKQVFPRISPAIIVLIYRDKEILLARSRMFKDELFSCIAGFVEPGETLEDAVRREIREELGIEVEEIRYFGSQPWPFPDSLMIAFTAKYKSGQLSIDSSELVEARWFNIKNLPKIPGRISIARHMIDTFFEEAT